MRTKRNRRQSARKGRTRFCSYQVVEVMKAKNPASGQGNSNCNPVATEPDPQKKAKLMNVFLKLLMQHVQS